MPTVADTVRPSPQAGPGLPRGTFRCAALGGFGDGCNSYAHAMAWYEDHLYISTTRNVLALLHNRSDDLKSWPVFPVRTARQDPYAEFDNRGRIWRYHPPSGRWERARISATDRAENGLDIPRFQGVRNLVPFQRETDAKPLLHALTWSPKGGPGPMLLRTADGLHFEELPIIGFAAQLYSTFRPLVALKGRLFTAPTGKTGSANAAGVAVVLESRDPETDPWKQVNEDDFGDPHNDSIFEMCAFNGHLYCGTLNRDGAQLWKSDVEGQPPYRWTRVLTRGAERGPHNEAICALEPFNGALYVGTGISNGGYDRKLGIGPAAVEVLRVWPDDSFDLIMGEGRVHEGRLIMPLSGIGPGFDSFFNAYLWRLCTHDGWLYAGTFSWSSLLPFIPMEKWPEEKRRMMDPQRMEEVMQITGGCDLWRSRDGETWLPVTTNGFNNRHNWGIRSMASTPYGLFVGTANPFGPDLNVPRPGGWQFQPNPRGGCEIWQGAASFADQPEPTSPLPPVEPLHPVQPLSPRLPAETAPRVRELIDELFAPDGWSAWGRWNRRDTLAAAQRDLLTDLLSFCHTPPQRVLLLDNAGPGGLYALREALPQAALTYAVPYRTPLPDLDPTLGTATDMLRVDRKGNLPLHTAPFDAILSLQTLARSRDSWAHIQALMSHLTPAVGLLALAEPVGGPPRRGWNIRAGNRSILPPHEIEERLKKLAPHVVVTDATTDVWHGFRSHLESFFFAKGLDSEIDQPLGQAIRDTLFGALQPVTAYIIAGLYRDGLPPADRAPSPSAGEPERR